jgi:hypothetical protein
MGRGGFNLPLLPIEISHRRATWALTGDHIRHCLPYVWTKTDGCEPSLRGVRNERRSNPLIFNEIASVVPPSQWQEECNLGVFVQALPYVSWYWFPVHENQEPQQRRHRPWPDHRRLHILRCSREVTLFDDNCHIDMPCCFSLRKNSTISCGFCNSVPYILLSKNSIITTQSPGENPVFRIMPGSSKFPILS